jgi:predicted nucleic acid-binding Zn ribbon protein
MTLDPSELARQLAARRKPKVVLCPICGTEAVGVGRRTYCSERCAKRAWWRRHRSKAARLAAEAQAVEGTQQTRALERWADDGGTSATPES